MFVFVIFWYRANEMKWSEYSNRIVWFSPKQLLLCSQGKEPSDQHIRQVCMRVMQGESGSQSFYPFGNKQNFLLCMQSRTSAVRACGTLQAGRTQLLTTEGKSEMKIRKICVLFQRFYLILLWWSTQRVSHQFCLSPSHLERTPTIPSWLFHSHFTEKFIFVSADLHFCLIVMSCLLQLGFLPEKAQSSIVPHTFSGSFPTESRNSLYPSLCSMAQGPGLDSLHQE